MSVPAGSEGITVNVSGLMGWICGSVRMMGYQDPPKVTQPGFPSSTTAYCDSKLVAAP